MSELYDGAILATLQHATTLAVEASTTPTLPVKYASITFDIPDDQKYLETIMIPNNIKNYWGDETNYRGMYRLILHWPVDGAGAYPPIAVLASICSYFASDTPLQNVQICETPTFGGVLETGTEILYPASLRYQCFRQGS